VIGRWFRRKPLPVPDAPAAPQSWDPLLGHVPLFERPLSTPRWDYVSMTGPYRTYRCDDDDEATMRYARVHESLGEAIHEFATINFPRVGQVCFLSDGKDQAILAWWDSHRGEMDLRFRWAGCKWAFELLAVVDPVNAALWEQLALQEVHT
jgi:hypothetical protein